MPHYETFSTQSGTITLRDSIVSSVEGGTTSDLAFKNGGRIVDILVHPGDAVKKWQVLARLGNNESDITIEGLAGVTDGLLWIKRETENMSIQTEAMKWSIEKLYDERIAQADSSIKQLKNELLKNEKNLSDTLWNLNEDYLLQLNNIINLANSSLHEWDKILWITTNFEYTNDAWETYLWARSGNSKADAENAWNKLYTTLWTLRSIKERRENIGAENAEGYIKTLESAYNDLRNYHEKIVYMLENSLLASWLTVELRNGWTTEFNTFKSNTSEIEWNFSLWKNWVTPLLVTNTGSKSTQEISLDSLRIQIENAEKNKDILLAEKKTKLRELSINVIEIETKKGELDTKIIETQMNQFLAKDANESDIIRAPYDGIILEKYMSIGTVIWQWVPLLRVTSDDKNLLKTYIDNTLYEYKIGDTVNLIDSVNNETLTGTITLLQKERDPLHNKNYTEITLTGKNHVIGERLIIQLSRKKTPRQNGTIIPVNAIITRYGPPWVYILSEKHIRFHLVDILASDLSFAEVIGIPPWSRIVTLGKENMYDGQEVQK